MTDSILRAVCGLFIPSLGLVFLAGDLKISETVDIPHVLVSMHISKNIFTQ